MPRTLSAESSLDTLKGEAKRWLRALREHDPAARARLERAVPDAPSTPGLRDVQHALAREHGFPGWSALKAEIERIRAQRAGADAANNIAPITALLAAADAGRADVAHALLDADPRLLNERGLLPGHTGLRTALHFAINGPHEEVVALLLDRGADPNIRDEGDNAFPLHFAAEKEHLPIIRRLVEHGADTIGAGDDHELEILGWATVFGHGNRDVVDYLLAHGARHTIASAVSIDDVDAIREIVAASPAALGMRMDRTNMRRTPLHLAVVKKQPRALATLLELGADTSAQDASGLTPLDQAALHGEHAMAETLIGAGADVELPAAIALERTDDIARLLQADHSQLRPGKRYGSLIVQASERANGATIELLLRGGASVNATVSDDSAVDATVGYTALHAAAFHGNASAAETLLKCGASVRAREERYRGTPAGWARYAGHEAICRMILQGDIDIFDAIEFDEHARIGDIVARDPGALTRRFGDYVRCGKQRPGEVYNADSTPLDIAVAMGKPNAERVLRDLAADTEGLQRSERVVRFLRNACPDWRTGGGGSIRMARSTASRLLSQHPDIARQSIYTAVACGDIETVTRTLAERPALASEPGGARDWAPLLYLASARLDQPEAADNAIGIARLLLDAGADPNASYPGGDSSIRYTVLTCVLGRGEEGAPPHPRARELAALLLERGAFPYDMQVLYNVFANHASRVHLTEDIVWLLELMHEHSVRGGRAADWDDPEWKMLDVGGYGPGAFYLLDAAIDAGLPLLAEWMLQHGAGPDTRALRPRGPDSSLYDGAVRRGRTNIAELFVRYGAARTQPILDDHDAFVAACLAHDRASATDMVRVHPEYLQNPRALVAAAERDDADATALLLDLGVSPDIEDEGNGRSRALHAAAFHGSTRAAAVLIARGAEIDPVETSYGATPLGVASWAQQPAMIDLLAPHSRDVFNLTFAGKVSRVRELLRDDPSLAARIHADRESVLMWLPDDEDAALELAELLLACGADASFRDPRGVTAGEMASRRAMTRVGALIEARGRSASS